MKLLFVSTAQLRTCVAGRIGCNQLEFLSFELSINTVETSFKVVCMFFFRESLKSCLHSNLIVRGLNFESVNVLKTIQFISFVKEKAHYTIEQQKCKHYEKRNRLIH